MRCGGSDRVVTACRASVTGKLHASTHSTAFSRRSRRQSSAHAAALKEARAQTGKEEITAAELKAVEDREIVAVIRKQEEIGLWSRHRRRIPPRILELRFSRRADGVEAYLGERKIKFQGVNPKPMMLRVTGKLGTFTGHPMLEHFKFVREHTKRRRR